MSEVRVGQSVGQCAAAPQIGGVEHRLDREHQVEDEECTQDRRLAEHDVFDELRGARASLRRRSAGARVADAPSAQSRQPVEVVAQAGPEQCPDQEERDQPERDAQHAEEIEQPGEVDQREPVFDHRIRGAEQREEDRAEDDRHGPNRHGREAEAAAAAPSRRPPGAQPIIDKPHRNESRELQQRLRQPLALGAEWVVLPGRDQRHDREHGERDRHR